jgi:predicted RNase H-like HicB family nuclease
LQVNLAKILPLARLTAFSSKQVSNNEDFMRYAVVIEKTENNYSAYVPDLPGCVATGTTVEETEQLIREAIEIHVTGLREDGLPVPQPSSQVEYVEVTA